MADDTNLFDGSLPISESLKQLRLRLLDLTSRNRLLNFKPSAGKAIQIVNIFPNLVWDRVTDNQSLTIVPVPEPGRDEYVIVEGRRQKPDVREHAKTLGINPSLELRQAPSRHPATGSEGKKLQALYYPEDLSRVCRKVFNHARTAIEETGSNMLYLVFGFLEFFEDDASDKALMAPLVAVPVLMKQGGADNVTGQPKFELTFTGEEITDNLSLREKLKQQFNIQLPEFEDDDAPEDYFEKIERLIERKDRWRVKRQVVVSILSFAKMVLVNDLDPNRWPVTPKGNSLTTHPLVKGVFLGLEEDRSDTDGQEYDVDDHPDNNLPLIYDADTYQHRALIDALAGKNMCINGPPGTGKSQTITNLIAAGLQRGLKVLFISDKLAALQVVKNRLELAGLGKFVLELHSNKTNKKRFLQEIEDRMKTKFPEPHDLPAKMQALEQRRLELRRYADTLNSVIGNELEMTVHEVLWAAEKNRQDCGDDARALEDITVAKAPNLAPSDLDVRLNAIRSLARHFDEIGKFGPKHPWFGFFPVSIKPGDDLAVHQLLQNLMAATDEVEERSAKFDRLLPKGAAITGAKRAREVDEKAHKIPDFPVSLVPELLPALFSHTDPEGRNSYEVIGKLKSQIDEVAALSRKIEGRLKAQDRVSTESLRAMKEAVTTFGKYKLATSSLTSCRNLVAQIEHAIKAVQARLHALEEYAKLTGLSLTGTAENLAQIAALVSIGSKALPGLLVYRHDQLGLPAASEALSQAKKTANDLAMQATTLNEVFYLDERPDAAVLTHAIQTFREGNAWYRIFQGEWRRAKKFYRTLARSKTKVKVDEQLSGLESLAHFFKKQDQFNSSDVFKQALGSLFKGEASDFEKLELLINWYSESRTIMFELAIPPETFNLTTVAPFVLAQLHKAQPECQEHMKELVPAAKYFEDVLAQVGVAAGESLADRIASLATVAVDVSNAVSVAAQFCEDATTPTDILKCVEDKLALDTATDRLNGNVAASSLLGKHFKGTQTSTKDVTATLEWGVQIAYGGFTEPLVLRVLQADCKEYWPEFRTSLRQVVSAWEKVAAFSGSMSKLGPFDWDKWNTGIDLEDILATVEIHDRAQVALDSLDELLPWAQYNHARVKLEEYSLGVFTNRLERGVATSSRLESGFMYRLHASIAQSIFRSRPELASFSTTKHNQIRDEFVKLDREIINLRGKECAHHIAKITQLPPGSRGTRVSDYTESELLYLVIPQQRPRVPIRQILKRAGKSIQALKPCFMMGPMAVAQYLEPGAMQFDLVVIDEASQLTPEEAIGALGRAKQSIVVGDPKQLPPTNFFNRMATTDESDMDEDSAISTLAGQESILDVCRSLMPERMLQLHYRSRHQSLIAFSNINFYQGKLVVFPSPFARSKQLGLHYHHVKNGIYQNKQNQPEAMRVVDAIIDHMRTHPDDSLGVCTLNMFQRDLIDELLEKRIKAFPECDIYRTKWEEQGWPFFIKNLENVQGDERDVIFISTTFGKVPGTNVVRQNFGPISRPTGWRRLNVLFTRARKSVHLYTSMEAEDIPIDQNTPEGTKALRGYLEYARSGIITSQTETDREPDSDFEVAVADVLRAKGYSVTPQLGVAGYFIDMAVKHPARAGEYITAIECDGASYHSGATVRDRDRIRQEILESLGWKGKIWRIWSTDWFRNPLREIQKLTSFLEERLKECNLEPATFHDEMAAEEIEETIPAGELDGTISQFVLNLASEDEGISVQVGDHVTYIDTAQPETKLHIQIVEGQDRLDAGIVNEARPLAQVLLDAEVGDEVELSIPGRPSHILKVLKIDRASSSAPAIQ